MKSPIRDVAAFAFLACSGGLNAQGGFDVPQVIAVVPDERPVKVAFFFAAGTPLERFTASPGTWYAIYRLPMMPGRPYQLILAHDGQAARMKAFALDDHPFGQVNVKFELPMRKMAGIKTRRGRNLYTVSLSIPANARSSALYLVLEWSPPVGSPKPASVSLQLLSSTGIDVSGEHESLAQSPPLESPLERDRHRTYEIPLSQGSDRDELRLQR